MVKIVYLVFGLIALGILVNLIWRISSQRQALPCPSWLGWMVELENPFTRVAALDLSWTTCAWNPA